MMLGIIIVDYKGSARTVEYVKSEVSKISIPKKVVIVNNCASDESNNYYVEQLGAQIITDAISIKETDDIFVIPSTENLGFAKGNNLGADFLIKNFHFNYLLFSNNDIILKDADVVESLINKLSSDSSIGMIGPQIVGFDGKRQSPEPYLSIESRFLLPYLISPFVSLKLKTKLFKLDYANNAKEGIHFRIMGAFFIMPTSVFEMINGMDPNTFLYAEELILAKRLESIGKSVYFYPDKTVIHAHGASTGKVFTNTKMRLIQAQSEKYYYTHYCNVSSIKAHLYFNFFKFYLKVRSWIK